MSANITDPVEDPSTVAVNLQPVGRRVAIATGQTVLEAATTAGIELLTLCGGNGWCEQCRVRLIAGELSPPTGAETNALPPGELADGWRLACQARAVHDVQIDIPADSLTAPQRLQVEGQQLGGTVDPVVAVADVGLKPPNLDDLAADASRVLATVQGQIPAAKAIDLPLLAELSDLLRAQAWQARLVVREETVVAALPLGARVLGLAVDVGTTKVAAYLLDLQNGALLGSRGTMNPQIAYGEDVISRIAYANDQGQGGRTRLQAVLVERLNELVAELCEESDSNRAQIVEAVVVGNTCMHHLLAGLPVKQLGQSPYVPAVSVAMTVLARELGLVLAPAARVYLPPNIAGYVGADHVAMVLASEIWQEEKTILALDIGTNTEITLVHGNRLLACSTASGPAFEGAHISAGMRAAPGAVERVQIRNGDIRTFTIGDRPAVGICGSGILDAIGEMVRGGIVDERGMLDEADPRVRQGEAYPEFVLLPASATGNARDLVVTRKDIHEVQMAKGAIRSGIEILLGEAGLTWSELDEVVIAGAFGTYLNPESAVAIGMFPPLPTDRFRQIGNAAGTGARQLLLSAGWRAQATTIADRIDYVELTTHPDFQELFLEGLYFRSEH